MSTQNFKFTLLSIAIGAMCGLPASADDSNQDKNRQQNEQSQSWSDNDSERSSSQDEDGNAENAKSKTSQKSKSKNSSSKGSQSGNRNGQQSRVPIQWVTVAVDYNHDGWYDGWETIYYYDYQQARESSNQRSQDGRQQANEGPRKASIQGEIVQMKTEKSSDGKNRRVVCRSRTRRAGRRKSA